MYDGEEILFTFGGPISSADEAGFPDKPDNYDADCEQAHIQSKRQGTIQRGELTGDPAEG